MNSQSGIFDFDEWKKLFESDPDAFEARRRELIDSEIQRASSKMQPRLRGLQWHIDVTRRRYKHPAVSSAILFEMMWQKVYGKNGLLEVLTAPEPPLARLKESCANLVYLRRKD
jgi:hypothetical protein